MHPLARMNQQKTCSPVKRMADSQHHCKHHIRQENPTFIYSTLFPVYTYKSLILSGLQGQAIRDMEASLVARA